MSMKRGFTMMELMITVVVLGILASIAIPQFQKTLARQHWQRAQDTLKAIYAGERAYFFAHGAYVGETSPDWNGWQTIHMILPTLTQVPVTYDVVGSGATFTATATDDNDMRNQMWIDQDGLLCTDPAIPPNNCGDWELP